MQTEKNGRLFVEHHLYLDHRYEMTEFSKYDMKRNYGG
jgi:hypothetical protein